MKRHHERRAGGGCLRATGVLAGAFILTALGACEPQAGLPESAAVEGTPALPAEVNIGQAVAFVDQFRAQVFLVDAPGGVPHARVVAVGTSPGVAVRRNNHNDLLLVTLGEPDTAPVASSQSGKPEAPALWRVPADAGSPAVAVPLGARFDNLAQSPDGRFTVAYFGANPDTRDLLFNPNQVAIIDWDASAPTAVPRSVRSLGGVPRAVTFASVQIQPGVERPLAVIIADNYVTLVDLSKLDMPAGDISIPLALPGDTRTLVASQVVVDSASASLFMRVAATSDIYGVRLVPLAAGETSTDGNDFKPSLSLLAGADNPADLALFTVTPAPSAVPGAVTPLPETRLLVVSGSSLNATVIDPKTGRSTPIPLPRTATHITVFPAPAVALLTSDGGTNVVTFLDLIGIEAAGGRNVASRTLAADVGPVVPLVDQIDQVDQNLALVLHNSPIGVSVVDVEKKTASPIFAQGTQWTVTLAPAQLRLWVTAPYDSLLGYLDLSKLATGQVRLDAPITKVHPLDAVPAEGAHAAEPARLLASHGTRDGYVTVVDATAPDRANAHALRGFFALNLLATSTGN